ncbi:MAG TPA: hypothetical protein VL442_18855 [Mucilaginibacter sp.]|jgi:hypothetical protein|nr:hypothetical protein [Mucilaginibacter sp.]
MRPKSFVNFSISAIFYTLLVCCNVADINNRKFEKAKWDSVEDLRSYPYREDMLKDLITHHKIKGLTRKQLIDSIGEPENYENPGDSIYYDIVVNYGYLDPKSGTYLAIGFNKDSIATGFKVVEWKNRHANE